jgi:hypothetical protein
MGGRDIHGRGDVHSWQQDLIGGFLLGFVLLYEYLSARVRLIGQELHDLHRALHTIVQGDVLQVDDNLQRSAGGSRSR